MGIMSMWFLLVLQYEKITVQSYTYNNTVNILSIAGYMMDL